MRPSIFCLLEVALPFGVQATLVLLSVSVHRQVAPNTPAVTGDKRTHGHTSRTAQSSCQFKHAASVVGGAGFEPERQHVVLGGLGSA